VTAVTGRASFGNAIHGEKTILVKREPGPPIKRERKYWGKLVGENGMGKREKDADSTPQGE